MYLFICDLAWYKKLWWPSAKQIKSEDNAKEAYAICLKEEDKAIGAIELKLNGHTDMTDRKNECELGYWLGKPFRGRASCRNPKENQRNPDKI